MKLTTFCYNDTVQWGVLSPDGTSVYPAAKLGIDDPLLESFILRADESDWQQLRRQAAQCAASLPLGSVKLLAAIPEPFQEILIMENNYCKDADEAAAFHATLTDTEETPLPTYFYKKATLANHDGGTIPSYPGHVETLDYQAELCFVVARDAYRVALQDAADYILGYLVINNVIARNLTTKHRRPYIATSLDGFLPMSPYLVTADEFDADPVFHIRSYVNGELRQDATTALLKFTPRYAIADLSRCGILKAGSIISTGTPFGCGCDIVPPQYLKSGDKVTCEVEGVGRVTSIVD